MVHEILPPQIGVCGHHRCFPGGDVGRRQQAFLAPLPVVHETLKWKLFPFSLSGEAKQWYICVVGCVNGSWIELRDRFCSAFFPLSRICALRTEILTFCQNDKELIGVGWARFTLLVK